MTYLTPQTIKIVKSTVSASEESGEILTQHFYKKMFAHNSEVLLFFNPANQQKGHQQKALASAICTYATNIDKLHFLGNAVELISQKHASLRIKPEHYPIVDGKLLKSIKEVLGKQAANYVVDTWSEAYEFLSNILMNQEKETYKTTEQVKN